MTELTIKKCPVDMKDYVEWDTVYAPSTKDLYDAQMDDTLPFTYAFQAKDVVQTPEKKISRVLKSDFCIKDDKYYYKSDKLRDMQSALEDVCLDKLGGSNSKTVPRIKDEYLEGLIPKWHADPIQYLEKLGLAAPYKESLASPKLRVEIDHYEPKRATLAEIDGDYVVLDIPLDRMLVKQIMAAVNDIDGEIFRNIADKENVFAVIRDVKKLGDVLNLLNTIKSQMLANKDTISAGKLDELIDKIDKVFYEKTQEEKESRSEMLMIVIFGGSALGTAYGIIKGLDYFIKKLQKLRGPKDPPTTPPSSPINEPAKQAKEATSSTREAVKAAYDLMAEGYELSPEQYDWLVSLEPVIHEILTGEDAGLIEEIYGGPTNRAMLEKSAPDSYVGTETFIAGGILAYAGGVAAASYAAEMAITINSLGQLTPALGGAL